MIFLLAVAWNWRAVKLVYDLQTRNICAKLGAYREPEAHAVLELVSLPYNIVV